MLLLPRTTISLVIDDDALTGCVVGESIGGAWVQALGSAAGFLGLSHADARRALGAVPADARLVLTLPSAWCSARPIGVSRKQWGGAREELLRSIEGLFPIPAEDAMVGLIDRASSDDGTASAGGYLIAASKRRVSPWIEAVERALGRGIDLVLPAQFALQGLGTQGRESATVVERLPSGATVEHTLRWGRITDLARPFGGAASLASSGAALVDSSGAARPVSAQDVAVAAVVALRVAAETLAPLRGPVPRVSHRWIPAAAAALVALVVFWVAAQADSWRVERGIARLEAERASSAAVLADVHAARERALRLASLLAAANALMPGEGADVLADLAAAQAALPEGGFMYRLELDDRALTLKGESKRAGDVLRALEDSPRFQAARELDTAVAVEERTTETFHIRAERTPLVASAAGQAEPQPAVIPAAVTGQPDGGRR
jgi:hypothetical protein